MPDIMRNRHSVYILNYHLVVCTKYRHPVLTGQIEQRLFEITEHLFKDNWGCSITELNCDKDHIHILFSAPPQVTLSELVNNFKTVTSRLLRKEFAEELSSYYWKDTFWSRSYYIGAVSDTTEEIVQQYIASQKTEGHHIKNRTISTQA